MRLALLCALLLGACTVAVSPRYGIHVGGSGRVGVRAAARRPATFLGLRVSLVSR